MASVSALADTVSLLLFQNLKEGMETGRIADLETAQTEVEVAIAELDRRRLLEGPTHINDLVGKMLLEIGSLHEKVAKCESQLAEFQSQAEAIKEETTQIVARAEACNLLVEQQQKENANVFTATEGTRANVTTTAPPPCLTPASSPVESTLYPTPSRMAVVSFPGGPRTVTIHPPSSPSYQSIIRDEKGDIIINFKGTKPLRREGAFRGPIEEINWHEIHCVYGRGPDLGGPRPAPPMPRWPDRFQPSSCPAPARSQTDITARQRQLSTTMQTDPFGRLLPTEHLTYAKSPSLLIGTSSSSQPPRDSQPSGVKPDIVNTPCSTPPSPSVGRGKKRTRYDEDEGALSTAEAREGDPLAAKQPTTPTPIKREESYPIEELTRRKKLRSSASLEVPSTAPLCRSHSFLDVTRMV